MGLSKGPHWKTQNIYIDYPFEDVMYRWDYLEERVYVKFYEKKEAPTPIPHDNRLFNDAILYGAEITKEQYEKGKKRNE